MTVKSAYVAYASKNGEFGTTERSYTVTWRVLTDSYLDGAIVVSAACPALGATYAYGNEVDLLVALHRKRARQVEATIWEVECEYTPVGDKEEQNPVARPPKRKWRGVSRETYPTKDLDGVLFVNSAVQRYDPPIAVEKAYGVLVIERNEDAFDYATTMKYQGTVNKNTFYGFDPGHVKMVEISADEDQYENGYTYCKVTYEMHCRDNEDESWNEPVLDVGTCWITKNGDGTFVRHFILPGEVQAATEPFLLDGSGAPLSATEINAGNAVYLDFTRFRERSWDSLRLEW